MADERTFTQAELDQIVSDRLRKERAKMTAEATQRAAELDRREAMLAAKEDWSKRGLPVALLDSLDFSKDGALDAAAAVLAGIQSNAPSPRGGVIDGSPGVPTPDPMRNAFGLK